MRGTLYHERVSNNSGNEHRITIAIEPVSPLDRFAVGRQHAFAPGEGAGEPWSGGALIRVHIGLENPADLMADLDEGFAAMRAAVSGGSPRPHAESRRA